MNQRPILKAYLRQRQLPLLLLIGALVGVIYWQGLPGTFLLDDYANLQWLPSSPAWDWNILSELLAKHGRAGPTGRPVSLISFYAQASSWPNDPGAFKAVNIALHIATGLLIYSLFKVVFSKGHLKIIDQNQAAFVVAVLWLANPAHISTVLYVVQRMTILATLFAILACIGYVCMRNSLLENKIRKAALITFAWVLPSLTLAVLSKENGATTPLLFLAIELACYSNNKNSQYVRWLRFALFAFLCAIILYLSQALLNQYNGRDFTPVERLLTQFRVVSEYVKLWLLPAPGQYSLIHDDYIKSTSLISPASTAICAFAISIVAISAFIFRKKNTIFFLAVLWFFAAHSLESTSLNLELFFEHRNYLPSVGLSVLIVAMLDSILCKFPSLKQPIALGGIAIAFSWLFILALEAQRWSNDFDLISTWNKNHPQSVRMKEMTAVYLVLSDRADIASDFAHQYFNQSRTLPAALLIFNIACINPRVKLLSVEEIKPLLRKSPFAVPVVNNLLQISQDAYAERCALPLTTVLDLLASAHENPVYSRHTELLMAQAHIADKLGDTRQAVALLRRAFDVSPEPIYMIAATTMLLDSKDPAMRPLARETLRAAVKSLRGSTTPSIDQNAINNLQKRIGDEK
ncbi:hypothetical protein [Chitinolyticbacter meiyuanensis]|uniref:hypothetical protein n=1 Tax=Chitinolyticbacter meiyuanensis TaxID=682798 RepID=UPI0011E59F11|nr:hypothetical protein [Chitinolyticbacter meiyuanensis]